MMYITAGGLNSGMDADLIPIYTINPVYGNIKRFWVITINKDRKIPFDARNTLCEVDCNAQTFKTLQSTWYLRGKVLHSDYNPTNFGYNVPGSLGEGYTNFVCNIIPGDISTYQPFISGLGLYLTDMHKLVPMVQQIIINASKMR